MSGELVLALGLFLASHSLPALPGVRPKLVARFGERRYLALYGLLSLVMLAWVIRAALTAPYVELWATTPWLAAVPIILMLPACALLVGGLATPNPLSVNLRPGEDPPRRAGVLALTRHPVLWAFALWGASHALANGDAASLVLFGGLAVFALGGAKTLDRRRKRSLGEARWRSLAEAEREPLSLDLVIALLGGAALYAALLAAHPRLFGVDPTAWLR